MKYVGGNLMKYMQDPYAKLQSTNERNKKFK